MVQIEFTHLPGYEPFAVEKGWRHLAAPAVKLSDDDVYDLASLDHDPIMSNMIDWLIDTMPEVIGATGDDESINDLSVDLASTIIDAAERVIDGKDCMPSTGGVWSERYVDVELAAGVTIRAAYFLKRF